MKKYLFSLTLLGVGIILLVIAGQIPDKSSNLPLPSELPQEILESLKREGRFPALTAVTDGSPVLLKGETIRAVGGALFYQVTNAEVEWESTRYLIGKSVSSRFRVPSSANMENVNPYVTFRVQQVFTNIAMYLHTYVPITLHMEVDYPVWKEETIGRSLTSASKSSKTVNKLYFVSSEEMKVIKAYLLDVSRNGNRQYLYGFGGGIMMVIGLVSIISICGNKKLWFY